ncbi:MAG: 2Fe-2S iron-sulfur cluster binding domain-containing protein [Patescibacteria group bacterium]|nr:2Fe-2S iron-sulfur cluster binding domain-containing protein [Patescibacteria group bacterium]
MAALQGVEIPLSCGCGVCGICLCDVESGGEYLQDDAYGNALMPLPHDEES